MDTQQPINTTNPSTALRTSPINTTNVTNNMNGRGDHKTKFLVIGAIILSLVLIITAATMGVRKSKEKNPAYLDPVTILKNTLFPPKINMTGPPGLPGGWVAPMPSTTPPPAPLTP